MGMSGDLLLLPTFTFVLTVLQLYLFRSSTTEAELIREEKNIMSLSMFIHRKGDEEQLKKKHLPNCRKQIKQRTKKKTAYQLATSSFK